MRRALNWRRELTGGETRPQVFECDDDEDWVLKLPGNPLLGSGGLCADWIGTALGGLVGLPVMQCDFVRFDEDALSTMPSKPSTSWVQTGLAFGTVYLPESRNVHGVDDVTAVAPPQDLARVVVVDTWLDVLDRKRPDGSWNLLIDTTRNPERLRIIDFGLALTAVLGVLPLGHAEFTLRCPSEWRPYVHPTDLKTAMSEVSGITEDTLDSVIAAIPETWLTSVPTIPQVKPYLQARLAALESAFQAGGFL